MNDKQVKAGIKREFGRAATAMLQHELKIWEFELGYAEGRLLETRKTDLNEWNRWMYAIQESKLAIEAFTELISERGA